MVEIVHHKYIHGEDFKKRSVVKAFSSIGKAEEFLVELGFVYGTPYPFRIAGWYHQGTKIHSNGGLYDVIDYIEANIESVEIDCGVEKNALNFFDAFVNEEDI